MSDHPRAWSSWQDACLNHTDARRTGWFIPGTCSYLRDAFKRWHDIWGILTLSFPVKAPKCLSNTKQRALPPSTSLSSSESPISRAYGCKTSLARGTRRLHPQMKRHLAHPDRLYGPQLVVVVQIMNRRRLRNRALWAESEDHHQNKHGDRHTGTGESATPPSSSLPTRPSPSPLTRTTSAQRPPRDATLRSRRVTSCG
jgi:hypothetical protein